MLIDERWNIYDGLLYPRMSVEDQFAIFNRALGGWQERSLLGKGYCKNNLDFYDGTIGYVIRKWNEYHKISKTEDWITQPILDFMDLWKYQGALYRVIAAPTSEIRYHKKIASWTKSVDVFSRFNKLNDNVNYTFVIADTFDYFGFDINKYNRNMNLVNAFNCHEEEVIFPMDKKYVKSVFYGALKEFNQFVKLGKQANDQVPKACDLQNSKNDLVFDKQKS